MDRRSLIAIVLLVPPLLAGGCASPYHADRGALAGGLTGAGVGALVGHSAGETAAGAVIGGAVGTLAGAAIGSEMDEMEARNRAMIEAQLGRQVATGAVTVDDVISMTRAGVSEDLIANHVRIHGVARPLQTADLIVLQNEHVSEAVVRAMQEPPVQQPVMVQAAPAPPPVIVEEYPYGPPVYYHAYPPPHYYPRRAGWGVTVYR